MHRSLSSQDLTEKRSPYCQKFVLLFFSPMQSYSPPQGSVLQIYFCASVFLKPAVSLQFRNIVRLCLDSPSVQAGSWGYSLSAPHLWLFCLGTLKCLRPNVCILLFHMFIWFCSSLKWDRFLVLGKRCQKLSISDFLTPIIIDFTSTKFFFKYSC